ncbi:hypothetical protein WUBG_09894, partial [Wuchereria bancrofti]
RIEENGRDIKEENVNGREMQRKNKLTKKKCHGIRRREKEREKERGEIKVKKLRQIHIHAQISYTYLPLNLCVAPNGASCISSIHFDTLTSPPDRSYCNCKFANENGQKKKTE